MKPWQQENLASTTGNTGFSPLTGVFTALSTGWYLFSLNIKYKKLTGSITIGIMKGLNHKNILLTSSCNVR